MEKKKSKSSETRNTFHQNHDYKLLSVENFMLLSSISTENLILIWSKEQFKLHIHTSSTSSIAFYLKIDRTFEKSYDNVLYKKSNELEI